MSNSYNSPKGTGVTFDRGVIRPSRMAQAGGKKSPPVEKEDIIPVEEERVKEVDMRESVPKRMREEGLNESRTISPPARRSRRLADKPKVDYRE